MDHHNIINHCDARDESWQSLINSRCENGFGKRKVAPWVGHIHGSLRQMAEMCREGQLEAPVLRIPDEFHPPPIDHLPDGKPARRFHAKFDAQILAGEDLEASLAAGAPAELTVQEWCDQTASILHGWNWVQWDLSDAGIQTGAPEAGWRDFLTLTEGVAACDSPIVPDAHALGWAYLVLGLAYLKEVQRRMQEYAEEESVLPVPDSQVAMTFNGGIFYGGQFAAQIANINSTIAGVMQQGSPDIAAALKALQEAVLSQEGLDGEHRQDLLDNVEYLAEVAQVPAQERKRGMVQAALAALGAAAASGTALSEAISAWGGVLNGLLP
ncbi:hypothetical protein [Streptomyces sp. NPDC060035]|uniref:hypothetical protein n=1 Tax=Streptomyces sp. NPDC060035 TaxID=3347044 RepID=UPI0036823363